MKSKTQEISNKYIEKMLKAEEKFNKIHRKLVGQNLDCFKLNNESENIDDMVARLTEDDLKADPKILIDMGNF